MPDTGALPLASLSAATSLDKDLATAKSGIVATEKLAATGIEAKNKAQGQIADQYKQDRQANRDFAAQNPYPRPDIKQFEEPLPQNDPLKSFGSWASAAGMLLGAVAGRGIKSSLNASAGAINAIRSNDLAAYAEHKDTWEKNTKVVIEQAEWQAKAYDNAWELMQKDQTLGIGALEMALHQADNPVALAELTAGNLQKVWEMTKGAKELALQGPKQFMEAQSAMEQQARIAQLNNDWLQAHPGEKTVPPDVLLNNRSRALEEVKPMRELTPAQLGKIQTQVSEYDAAFDAIDQVKNSLSKMSVGLGGRIGRPIETLGEILELSDDATKTQLLGQLAYVKQVLPHLMTGTSRQPTKNEMTELEKMLGGESVGSTVQNVAARLDDMQDRLMTKYDVLRRQAGMDVDAPRGNAREEPTKSDLTPDNAPDGTTATGPNGAKLVKRNGQWVPLMVGATPPASAQQPSAPGAPRYSAPSD